MTRHRIAMIGLGMAVSPHAKSLLDLQDRVEVAYAFSRSEARRRAFAERFDFPVTGDLDRIVDDAAVDAVMILTPPNTHLELVERFAAAGKHILLEKPLERSTERALRLVEAAEGAGVQLGVVFQHRFREASEHLRQLLRQRALGELAVINVSCPWWRAQSYYDEPGRGTLARDGGGVLITQAIHTLDLTLSLAGPVAEVAAITGTTGLHRMEREDFAARRSALCQRRCRRADGDHGGVPRLPRADRADRHQGHRRPHGRRGHGALPGRTRGARRRGAGHRRRCRPDGVSRTTPTARCLPTFSMRSTRIAAHASPAARRCACTI